MKYNFFKKLAAINMAAIVSLSAVAPTFAADDTNNSNEESSVSTDTSDNADDSNDSESSDSTEGSNEEDSNNSDENVDSDTDSDTDTPNDSDSDSDTDAPNDSDTDDDTDTSGGSGSQEELDTSDNETSEDLDAKENVELSEIESSKLSGYEHVNQAGGKGDSLVTLEIVNDGSDGGDDKDDPDNPGGEDDKDPDNPGGGDDKDPDNPGGGDDKDPDNPGGGDDKDDPDNPGSGDGDDKDPEPMIFSAYVPSKLPMKLTEDGTVLTPSKAAIVNGVATKGIAVKDIEAHLDYGWDAEDWNADYSSMSVNTKNVGLKLRGDTLSKNGDFSVNAEDWKIPKDSYIDLNMEAKLPPQKIETVTENSDVARLSFTLDWSGDDATTGPKWEGGTINPDNPNDNPSTLSKPKVESSDVIVVGGNGSIKVTWNDKDGKITLDRIVSSSTDVVTIGDITGSDGNKTATINGLKGGTSTITVTLSNGETATYEVIVYEVGNPDDIQVTVSNKNLGIGDSVTSNDVTASVPLIAPDGSIKTITVKPSINDNTLQAGNNSLTGTVTIGGQDYPIHFDVAVEDAESNKSGIKAESTDTFIAGESGDVKFTWDTKGNTITLTGITSSDESIATVGTITGADGGKTVNINALKGGTATITATLSNGETATYEVKVYTVGNANDIQVTVNNQNLGVGDTVTPNDVTVKVPIISPDGETIFIEKTPSIEDNTLKVGDNTITGTVTVGKATFRITITVTVEEMTIPISITSMTYIVGNENNIINFKWDTKDDSINLSEVTSSNTDVTTIKTTTGEEGDKTVALDCLKAGTTNIELIFSNGSTASCEITVYEVGNLDDTKVIIADKEFNAGDTLSSEDVTIRVPLVDGEGNTKLIDMSVDFEDTTLKPGTNNFTVNIAIGGQTHTVNFNITTEIPEDMKSGIKAETTDTLIAGGTGNVAFTWDTRGNTISLTGVTSSSTDVVSIGTTTGSEGNKTTILNALKGGASTITATLSNGETTSIDIPVYVVDTTKDMQIEVTDKKYNVGDKVTSNDVTVKVPLTAPDGSTKYIDVHPSVENKALVMGDNTLKGTVVVGNNTYNINITITVENPSNGLVMSVPEAQAMGFTFASYQDGLEITGFENKMFKSTINVPEQIGDFKVLKIGNKAFCDQTNLKALNLPNSIIEIDSYAFNNCSGEINGITASTHIAPKAFCSCPNACVTVPLEIVNYNNFGTKVFGAKTDMGYAYAPGKIVITLPKGKTGVIQPGAFLNTEHLTEIVIPEGITNIGSQAFYNTDIKNIIIPEGVTHIESKAFYGCTSLTHVEIPSSMTTIASDAFGLNSKTQEIIINKPKDSISGAAWRGSYTGNEKITIKWKN